MLQTARGGKTCGMYRSILKTVDAAGFNQKNNRARQGDTVAKNGARVYEGVETGVAPANGFCRTLAKQETRHKSGYLTRSISWEWRLTRVSG